MVQLAQTVPSPSPQVFSHSLDWRFLLPLADPQRTCLLFEDNPGLNQALDQVRIHVSQRLTLSALPSRQQDRFQLMILPFGLPVGWAGAGREDRVQFYASLRRLIDSGGQLLIGFNHLLNVSAPLRSLYRPSTPQGMTSDLLQAGFRSVQIHGAMPDLQIPEYLFELDPRAIHFALRNRFRRKPVLVLGLQLLARLIGWKSISNLLPCYFAVASA